MIRAKRFGTLPVLAVVVMALLACKKNKEGEKTEGTTAAATGENSVGVPECDEYLAKYEKCVSEKIPETARASMKQGLDTMRNAWKQAASNPVTKSSLAQTCKQALETAKTSMATYNCSW